MPGIEITYTIKLIAAGIAVLVAFFMDTSAIKRWLGKLNPVAASPTKNIPHTDSAVRVLLDDSVARNNRRSVELLNEWINIRNTSSLPETTPVVNP